MPYEVLFADQFERASDANVANPSGSTNPERGNGLGPDWKVRTPTTERAWSISSGRVIPPGNTAGEAWAVDASAADGYAQVDANAAASPGTLGVLLRLAPDYQPSSNSVTISISYIPNGGFFLLGTGGSGLSLGGYTVTPGSTYSNVQPTQALVRAECEGAVLRGYVDGVLQHEATTDLLVAGQMGMVSRYVGVTQYLDNFEAGALVPEPPVARTRVSFDW